MREAAATVWARPQAKLSGLGEESDEPVVPMKATKAAGGKGLYSMTATEAGKERRLWQH